MKLLKGNENDKFFPTLLSDFFDNDRIFSPGWLNNEVAKNIPAVNIKENGKEFNIELAVPGFTKKDFHVSLENNIMTISAEKEEEKIEEAEHFTRKEFSSSSFSRSFTLPKSVEFDQVDAKYSDGILKITVPKKEMEPALPKKEIKVN